MPASAASRLSKRVLRGSEVLCSLYLREIVSLCGPGKGKACFRVFFFFTRGGMRFSYGVCVEYLCHFFCHTRFLLCA